MANPRDETIWVVVRLDLFHGTFDPSRPRRTITLKEALPSAAEADAEVERLNELRSNDRTTYFAAPTKWFPEGRGVERGY